jgi:threonine/homoserine/homoserine lactone efflux protein
MPAAGDLAAFAVTAFIIIVIPGPSVLFIVARALAHGRKVSVLTVIGNTAGEYVQVAAVAFGVGLLAERSVEIFTVLKLFGAAYLVFLGVQAFRHRRSLAAALALAPDTQPAYRYFFQGFVVGVSNPKTVIFLVAIMPQFVTRAAGAVPGQILLLGLVFSAIALICDSIWGLAAGTVRSWFARSPRRLELVGGIGGLSIVAIGIGLALTGRHPDSG